MAEVLVQPGDVIFPALDNGVPMTTSEVGRAAEVLQKSMPGVRVGGLIQGARDTIVYRTHNAATSAARQVADLDSVAQRARAAYSLAAYGIEPGDWEDATDGEKRRWRLVVEAVQRGDRGN